MNKLMKPLVFVSIVVLSPMFVSRGANSFNNKAHEALSERATKVSSLDNFLKVVLAFEFPDGIDQRGLAGKIVTRHIQDGALLEDSLAIERVRHHFHNPKLAWDQAGLRPPGASSPIGQSSIVWSQNSNQADGGKASWHQAREAYFKALTVIDPFARKVRWAEVFRFLGHAIHHVQDAAAPSHTRNDSHLPVNSDQFHSFAERPEILALINTIAAPPLDPSFLSNQTSPDSRYPVPIARLLDTTAADIGASALGNGSGIGIAEYSNANFFSDDTIFPETFPYPGLSNLQLSTPELNPNTGQKKTYLIFKPGFGDGTNYRLAQASSLRNITGTNVPTDIGLDYRVLTDYAFKLLPRAIGYSAGMIDYFFRGRVQAGACCIDEWGGGIYRYLRGEVTAFQEFSGSVWALNEEATGGSVVAVISYSLGANRGYMISAPVTYSAFSNASADSAVDFNFSGAPGGAATCPCDIFFVFRGPLGQENDAVAVGPAYFVD